MNIEIGNVKEQISKLEGWHDQWIAQQEANRASARAENQRLKNKPKYDATDWRNKQRVKDAALDQMQIFLQTQSNGLKPMEQRYCRYLQAKCREYPKG